MPTLAVKNSVGRLDRVLGDAGLVSVFSWARGVMTSATFFAL
jgi:hypothetical protein